MRFSTFAGAVFCAACSCLPVSAWGQAPAPAEGTYNALVIFAKFQGEATGADRAPEWADGLFDPGLPGSFTHFYNEMSRGRLQVQGQVLPRRYTSSRPAADYTAKTPGGRGDFAAFNIDILQQADADVDMGLFDNDGPDGRPNSGDDDGYVDIVFINLLTVPRNFFIGGATGLASLGLDADFISDDVAAGGGFVRVRGRFSGFGGTTQRGHTFSVTASTMCHEFGHVLGLPDLFDQSSLTSGGELDPEADSAGIGKWGLMGLGTLGWGEDRGIEDGPNAFSGWALAALGWVDVEEVTQSRSGLRLGEVLREGRVYKIPLTRDEYFLLEYRRAAGSYYNRNIPADGLLVWHVEERADNDEERHKQVDLVCADGLYADKGFPGGQPDPVAGGDNLDFWSRDAAYAQAHNGNKGDATDPFDGTRFDRFAWDTNPRPNAYTGLQRNLPLGIAVENMRVEGEAMVVDVRVRQPRPGHIVTDAVWQDTVRVEGDIVVEPGATLTLRPGTVVRFAASDGRAGGFDPRRCELLVLGALRLEGSAEAPVRLEGDGALVRWSGLYLLDGQDLAAEHLVIEDALRGVVRGRLPAGTSRLQGRVDVPGDLFVPADAELVIEEGAAVRFGGEDLFGTGVSPALTELVVEGTLRLEGSAASGVRLTTTAAGAIDDELWYGMRLVEGGRIVSRHAQVDQSGFAYTGTVGSGGGLEVADGQVRRSFGGLNLVLRGEATVDRSLFTGILGEAVRAEGDGLLRLRDVTVEENGRAGISLGNASLEAIDTVIRRNGIFDPDDPRPGLEATGGRGQHLEFWNSRFERNALHGADLGDWRGTAAFHDSRFDANQGDGLVADGLERLVFEGVVVERNLGRGVAVAGGVSEIWTTSFLDNSDVGLLFGVGAAGVVDMSRFLGNAALRLERSGEIFVLRSSIGNALVGLESRNSAPVLRGNTFNNNRTALRVSGVVGPHEISGNTFTDNRTAIENLTGAPLDAAGNFWGTTDAAAIAGLFAGEVDWTPFLDAEPTATAVGAAVEEGAATALTGHFPNPFNAQLAIGFRLAVAGPVALTVFDALGRPVRRLLKTTLPQGEHRRVWDGRDEGGRPLGSGVYFYRLEAGAFEAGAKVLLLR